MKIMQVMFSRGKGGLERVFVDHAVMLARRGHVVHCVILDRVAYTQELMQLADESNGSIVLHVCDAHAWRRLMLPVTLYKLIARIAPQAIIAHGAKVTSRLSSMRPRQVPLIGITHNASPRLMRATHLIVLTQHLRKLFEERGYPASRMQQIPNPLPTCTNKEAVRQAHAADQPLRIGTLSRLVEKKGIDIFLRGFRIALDRGLKAQAIIGGDGPEKAALEKLCYSLGLDAHVSFKGWVTEQCTFYSGIDWLCVPSRDEPFGLVALEGFRYGVPVLAARVGGLTEIINDGSNGVLFDAGNPDALADALLQLGAETQALRAQQIRDAAYASLQLYAPELIAARMESALLLAIADIQAENRGLKLTVPGHRPV